jgi:hypothetical protein
MKLIRNVTAVIVMVLTVWAFSQNTSAQFCAQVQAGENNNEDDWDCSAWCDGSSYSSCASFCHGCGGAEAYLGDCDSYDNGTWCEIGCFCYPRIE